MTTPAATVTLETNAPRVQRAMARSALFRFFSLASGYPTAERFRTLREGTAPAAHAAAAIAAKGLMPRLEALARHLEAVELEELQTQCHRTFGHVPLTDCPPYESGYLGAHLFRQVNVMADVAGCYRAFGLRIGQQERERVDHLTVELEFMRFLTYKEAFALVHHGRSPADICRRAQRHFWREHLGRWLPTFALLLAERAQSGFYGELAPGLAQLAEAETRVLGKTAVAQELSPQPPPFSDMDCSLGEDICPLAGAGNTIPQEERR